MFYKNLSIGKKIAVVFAVIAAVNVIFGIFLSSELRGVRDRVLNFTDSTLPSVLCRSKPALRRILCAPCPVCPADGG
ncbi:hypothetical protein ACF2JD_01580 [Aeromonas sp. A-5]|uniref:hypothetical protein n=1 Tax=Aeromonas ichthyocola TaxID=3367746 RepID=UPI0038E41CF1